VNPIKTAVVTGRHPYDVMGFHDVFRSIPEADCYIQHMEDFVSAPPDVRSRYEAVVFYHFHQETPGDEKNWWDAGMKAALETLGETSQGIFIMHHAILAFPQWSSWAELVGVEDRAFEYYIGEKLTVEVADPNHPITQGLPASWGMVDETYKMADAGEDCHVLLTTDHAKSMRTLAWTRRFKNARVFCLESGHDNETYVEPSFRTVVGRGIQWVAGRI